MKVASNLMVKIPVLRYDDHVTKARSVLRDDVFRELYVVDEKNRLMGYLDISDVLRVVDTKSNVTIKGFVREAARVTRDTPLTEVARAIMDAYTNSAAVVDEDGVLLGGVLFSELFPVLISRRNIPGRVGDVMTREPITCAPEDPIHKIYSLIVSSGFIAFPVVQKDEVIGIISRRDLLRAGNVRISVKNQADTTVDRVMTTPVVSVTPDDQVATAARLMVDHDISILPVIDERKRIVGIIDRHDVSSCLIP
ncbi:putative signal transduction protein with CBS domains [Methanoculleus bourgensis MS2]|jgi:CBS domain-containing protein|uniref:Signal transduction protein with CBS domains n=1 Tax=Methanoculleus bourgensis (strain ATCC 43281 / DSM 3045 / OCM 15 / MS2) TaxID=1201294 RepID=I7LLN7_METBM|nr:CBS domain-containing protein [Methanoculleus bourgensis]CCJ35514.1 putative signal transduction protein with CBS domains [Methanoculleus bourgensis MS2]